MFGNNATRLMSSFVNEGFNIIAPPDENITNDLNMLALSKMSVNELYFIFLINSSEKKDVLKPNSELFANYTKDDGFKNLYLINLYIIKEENNFADIDLEENEVSDNKKIQVFSLEVDFKNKKTSTVNESIPLKKTIEKAINNSFFESKAFKNERTYTVEEVLERSENLALTKEKYKTPILTYGLMIINLIMFVLMKIYELNLPQDSYSQGDALIKFGALFAPSVIFNGEYWRLITAMFVHIDIFHILFNMFSLYIFGKTLEKSIGRISYSIIYFSAGILANFFDLFSSNSFNTISAGASGGIYALIGGLLALTLVSKRSIDSFSFTNMALFIGIGVIMDIFKPENNSLVHTLGVILGFIISYLIFKFVLLKRLRKNIEAMD